MKVFVHYDTNLCGFVIRNSDMKRYLLFLLLTVFAVSCDDESPLYLTNETNPGTVTPEQQVYAGTDQYQYALREPIYISIRNASDVDLTVPTCASQISYYIQQKVKGVWTDAGANGIPCTGYNHEGTILVRAHQTYTYRDAIVAYGHYRLRYPVTLGGSTSVWLYTNEFLVGEE